MIFNQVEAPRIAIVGGGFCGTLALANIVAKAGAPLVIDWFDMLGAQAKGVAYGTTDMAHLLNVRAGFMGAFADKPGGFYDWLLTVDGRLQAAKCCPEEEISPDSYVPRALYGAYLKYILDQALALAKEKNIAVTISQGEVIDAQLHEMETQQLRLSIMEAHHSRELVADALVLATGNLPPRRFGFQQGLIRGARHYVADVWKPAADSLFPAQISRLSADDNIVIIGTGLTMVDTVLALKNHGYAGKIIAISRHGWLPAVHAGIPLPAWELRKQWPATALGLLQAIRHETQRASENGHDWRSVIDALRPITQPLWQQLPMREKRRFVTRLSTLWGIHRHRMAPACGDALAQLRQTGALRIIAGKIYYAGSGDEGLNVAYRPRGGDHIETIHAALVLNCTGPEGDISASPHRLLKNLCDRGLIALSPLRIGIALTAQQTAQGSAPDAIFPLGNLLAGALLECTAVPELRAQAEAVAGGVLKRIQQLREKDRAVHLLMGAWI